MPKISLQKFNLQLLVVLLSLSSYQQQAFAQNNLNNRSISYILIDGLSKSVFDKELASGNLPHIESMIKKSTYFPQGLGSFPSMTAYAYYPFLTGKKAIKSGILGLRWFDRSRNKGNLRNYVGRTNLWINQDIVDSIKTIFEYFPDHNTTSLNSILDRGVQESNFTSWSFATAKYESKSIFKLIKKLPIIGSKNLNHFEHESLVMQKALDQLKNKPKIQWITISALDATNHINGSSEEYIQLLRHIDQLIGIFIAEVKKLGQNDQRMIALITDHGVADVNTNHNVPVYLDTLCGIRLRRGAPVSILKKTLDTQLSSYNDVDGIYVVNGNLIGFIYLRDPDKKANESWRHNIRHDQLKKYNGLYDTLNIIQSLTNLEGISFIAFDKEKSICIASKNGKAFIEKIDSLFVYHVDGDDPLGIDQCLHNNPMSESDWLKKTINTKYPMAIPRLYDLMSHADMGDILLCSKSGYDLGGQYEFLVNNYKGGHGGLRKELTVVPYILHIPNQEPQIISIGTSQDVGKIIMKYMGIEID